MDIHVKISELHKNILLSLHELHSRTQAGRVFLLALTNCVAFLSNTKFNYLEAATIVARGDFGSLTRISSEQKKEISDALVIMEAAELIKKERNASTRRNEYLLTEEGKRVAQALFEERLVLLRPPSSKRKSAFIACAFGKTEINRLFERELAPACSELQLTPHRVDLLEPKQTITAAITAGILEARCIVADLTHARPSVYFEVGFAHGLGVPMVLTCRKDHYRGMPDDLRVHFDLEQYKISYWETSERGFSWASGMRPIDRLRAITRS